MDELLTIAQKLSGVSFATLVTLILAGSYFRKWVWGYVLTERIAEEKARYEELKAQKDARIEELKSDVLDWKSISRAASSTSETAVNKLKAQS